MTDVLKKLIDIAGEPFAPPGSVPASLVVQGREKDAAELDVILSQKNGFFAFESALRVFPSGISACSWNLSDWNDSGLWRAEYGDLTNGLFFFAEDIFGGQFCSTKEGICRFDPETADLQFLAHEIEEWASKLLLSYDTMVGYQVAHAWQAANGPLKAQQRLMPKLPFVVGGTAELSNLVAMDSVRVMKNLGNLARQIRDLPDGSKIRFEMLH